MYSKSSNIKPISDLRNYSEVLRDVAIDSPVFLTKNGRGRYAIMDIQDYERVMATIKLQENKNENDLIFLSWVLSHSHFIFRINDEVNVL